MLIPDFDAETLGPLLAWISENLAEDLGVDRLAREYRQRMGSELIDALGGLA